MLTITQMASGAQPCYSLSVGPFSGTVTMSAGWSALVVHPTNYAKRLYLDLPGYISTGSKKKNGYDRPCSHVKLEGSVSLGIGIGGTSFPHTTKQLSYRDTNGTSRQYTQHLYGNYIHVLLGPGTQETVLPPQRLQYASYPTRYRQYRNQKITTTYDGEVLIHTHSYEYMNEPEPNAWYSSVSEIIRKFSPDHQYYYTGTRGPGGTIVWSPNQSRCTKSDLTFGQALPDGYFSESTIAWWVTQVFGRGQRDNPLFGDAVRQAANDARYYDVNGLEFLKELPDFLRALRNPTRELLRIIGRPDPKNLADAYLSYKYGARLTVNDAASIRDGLVYEFSQIAKTERNAIAQGASSEAFTQHMTLSGRQITGQRTAHVRIDYQKRDDYTSRLLAMMDSSGILPTPKALWELVPFTFVVDWFLDTSNYLDVLSSESTWQIRRVHGCISSMKETAAVLPADLGMQGLGIISFTKYDRYVDDHIPYFSAYVDHHSDFSNYAEATALIFSRRR